MKRIFDVLVSLILLLLLSPLIFIVAILVKKKLGIPILFKQQRPGLYSKPFYLYKYRTMTDEKDHEGNLMPDHVRLTSFGKFLRKCSLDELPQLINVLKGDISLVGPRPLLMEYVPLYSDQQLARHNVRPGITGWAQVNGRNAITWEEKFELDVWYVENQSFWLDIKILFLTVYKVFKSEGINQQGSVTTERFKGQITR
ncbi:sugar transferase [Alkalihalobacterium chitinilyticum]|uniref:Sugar transferase n=1 Tax=Alkalihalobacterium chitinilyticum TaxID=2980103 RepID=A0ABT5VH50_9BACI|nr:sugar transferase [Alkalihalobacterium chitinilyticum]MDE5413788.1 sugar transferase [Alkalihalobacterium chitinilyticum]